MMHYYQTDQNQPKPTKTNQNQPKPTKTYLNRGAKLSYNHFMSERTHVSWQPAVKTLV